MPDKTQNYPEILSDLRDSIFNELMQSGIPQPESSRISQQCSDLIMKNWGGLGVYIPKGTGFKINKKRRMINQDIKNGLSRMAICRKHDVSQSYFYKIIQQK